MKARKGKRKYRGNGVRTMKDEPVDGKRNIQRTK